MQSAVDVTPSIVIVPFTNVTSEPFENTLVSFVKPKLYPFKSIVHVEPSFIFNESVITTSIKHRDYSQVISDTENVTITNNKSLPCFSKYKQICMKIYNKIFYKTTKELTQRNENENKN